MQDLHIIEIAVSTVMFMLTLLICYAIWHVLFGKRMPLPDHTKSKANPGKDCPLNKIMGYDFIQVKTIEPSVENDEPAGNTASKQTAEQDGPALYAVADTEPYNIFNEPDSETEPDPVPEKQDVLNLTDDDMDVITKEPWEQAMDIDELERMAKFYASQPFPPLDTDDREEENFTEQEMEHEAEFDQYRDDFYDSLDNMTQTDEDREALLDLDKELDESEGSDIEEDESPEENDIPEI